MASISDLRGQDGHSAIGSRRNPLVYRKAMFSVVEVFLQGTDIAVPELRPFHPDTCV